MRDVDPVALTRALVGIPSPTGDEGAVATFLAGLLEQQGYNVVLQPVTPGRANVYAQHCAFGPHAAAVVHLRDTGGPDANGAGTLVRLEHCSALLDGGAVVWAEDGAGGRAD